MTESKTKYIFKVKVEFIFKQASDPAFLLYSFLKQAVSNDGQTRPSHSFTKTWGFYLNPADSRGPVTMLRCCILITQKVEGEQNFYIPQSKHNRMAISCFLH